MQAGPSRRRVAGDPAFVNRSLKLPSPARPQQTSVDPPRFRRGIPPPRGGPQGHIRRLSCLARPLAAAARMTRPSLQDSRLPLRRQVMASVCPRGKAAARPTSRHAPPPTALAACSGQEPLSLTQRKLGPRVPWKRQVKACGNAPPQRLPAGRKLRASPRKPCRTIPLSPSGSPVAIRGQGAGRACSQVGALVARHTAMRAIALSHRFGSPPKQWQGTLTGPLASRSKCGAHGLAILGQGSRTRGPWRFQSPRGWHSSITFKALAGSTREASRLPRWQAPRACTWKAEAAGSQSPHLTELLRSGKQWQCLALGIWVATQPMATGAAGPRHKQARRHPAPSLRPLGCTRPR